MDLTPFFDIVGALAFAIALWRAIRLPSVVIAPIPKAFLVTFLSIYLVVMVMNSLEHAHVTSWFDQFEDPLEIMFLPFFFFFVFSLKSTEEISRRARVEEQLHGQRHFLGQILETIPHGIEEIDTCGTIIFANPGLHKIYGYGPDELMRRSVFELSPSAEAAARLRSHLQQLVETQPKPTPWYDTGLCKDGRLVDVQVDWDYKRDQSGRVVGFISAITDITTSKRMADELALSEQRFRQLVENAGDSFFIVNARGWVIAVNQQAALSTGYSREELMTMHISEIDLDYPKEKEAAVVWEVLQQEPQRTFRGLHRRKDGSTFPVEVRAALIDYQDDKAIFGIVRDISQRVAVENTLRTQAQIINQTHDAVATTDFHGVITSWNHGAEELLGYAGDEAMGRPIVDFCPPEYRKALKKSMLRPLFSKGCHEFEIGVVRKDGATIHGHMSLSLLRNDQDRPIGVVVYLLDITARREAEEALRISEERLRLALAAGRQGMYDLDLLSGNAVINDEYGAILGYGPGEFALNLSNWRDSIHPEDRERVNSYFSDYLARGGGDSRVEYRQRTKDGRWKWILSLGRVVAWDAGGRPLRMLGTHTDLTEEKEIQAAIAMERQQLYDLLGGLPGFVCLLAPDYTFRFGNHYFKEHFGDYEGKRCHEVLHQCTGPCEDCDLGVVLGENAQRIWEWDDAPDHRIYQVYDFPFRDVDGGRLLLKFGLDITERKAAEEEKLTLEKQLLNLQKLESLGVMAGGIAHDFNNLLMAIMGNTDLALLTLAPEAPAREQLLAAKAASRRAAELCKQMLAYAGRGTFALIQVDLSHFIEESRELLDVSVAKKSSIVMELSRELPSVDADPIQLRQLLVNIVTNAAEAITSGGTITIKTYAGPCEGTTQSCPYQTELPIGLCVMLRISDTGCGMDAETVSRLFDPFFTTKFTGRGLGMAAALGIVRAHHGAIMVESEPGRGTVVTVSLPVSSGWQEPHPTGPATGKEEEDGRAGILLVDDEEDVLEVAEAMLELLGYQVFRAMDGQECLDMFERYRPRIKAVLLDLAMPRMNGIEAVRQLRRLDHDLPIILSSGFSEQQATQQLGGEGLAGFIQKPYNVEQLRQVLAVVAKSTD